MIYLREITETDLPEINKYRNDMELATWLTAPFRFINMETDHKWFQSYLSSRNENVRCAICLKSNHQIIGMVNLLNIRWEYRSAEYSILIGEKEAWGKGYGTTATREILKHAFCNMGLNRIQLIVMEHNERAINMYRKAGFKEEGLLRQTIRKGDTTYNTIIMSLLREEYDCLEGGSI
jgi:RimJ/RimL family protein N-acetyltransferase